MLKKERELTLGVKKAASDIIVTLTAVEESLGERTVDVQKTVEPLLMDIAKATSSLVKCSEELLNRSDNNIIDLLFVLSKRVRSSSLDYIRTTKSLCSNSMDFMTAESQTNAKSTLDMHLSCTCILSETLVHQESKDSLTPRDSEVMRFVTLADELSSKTRHFLNMAIERDLLNYLNESGEFFHCLNQFVEEVQKKTNSSVLSEKAEALKRCRLELIQLTKETAVDIKGQKSAEISQQAQSILGALLDQEIDVLLNFLHVELSSNSKKKEESEIIQNVGPRRPRKKKASSKRVAELASSESTPIRRGHSKSEKIENLRLDSNFFHSSRPNEYRPASPSGLSSPRQTAALDLEGISESALLNERQQMAMEATMASAVPIVVGMFSAKFGWFNKEWQRESGTAKQKFMTDMRNELTKLKWYEDKSSPLDSKPKRTFTVLSKTSEMKEETELQQMLKPQKSDVQWMHRVVSLSNLLDSETIQSLKAYQNTVEERIDGMCDLVSKNLQSSETSEIEDSESNFSRDLSKKALSIFQMFNKIIILSTSAANDIVHDMAKPVKELIMSSSTKGKQDEKLIAVLRETNSYQITHMVGRHLKLQIREKLVSLKALGFQTAHIIQSVELEVQQKISHASTLQLLAIARRSIEIVVDLLKQITTFLYIQDMLAKENMENRMQGKTYSYEYDDVPYWSFSARNEEGADLGTLNFLIFTLTSPKQDLPEGYETGFINLYETFCSSYKFFAKLVERYSIPESADYSEGAIRELRLRICEILKHWFRKKFCELDKNTVEKIHFFMKNSLIPDGYQSEVNEMEAIMNAKLEEEQALDAEFKKFEPIPKIQWNDINNDSLYRAFLDSDEKTIAEQLTLHDWNLFKRIQPSELIGQAWNKNKHCASNILEHIKRLNHVSYWVPSLILWSEKLKERGTVLLKFVRIGQELLKLHNYNTLMGIVAGLNMSSVRRLKFTMTVLSDNQVKEMEDLLELMGPFKRYKQYKDHVAQATMPAIPYLGIYLTDLTFIEDGNPDTSDGLIFFRKRVQLSKVIEFIAKFQEIPYDFEQKEPLYSYLRELPGLVDEALYQLSLIREPREAEITDIL